MQKKNVLNEGHKVDPALVQKYINEIDDYIAVAPVDIDKTLCLVTEVKGIRSYNVFAEDADFTGATMSRILSKKSASLSKKSIARIAAADLTGNISLDMIMEAQGKVHKDRTDEYWKKIQRIVRQIILDELANGEYILSNIIVAGNSFSVKIRENGNNNGKNGNIEFLWKFNILLDPLQTDYSAAADQVNKIKNTSDRSSLDRCSLIVDNEVIFNGVVEELKSGNNAFSSVILISIPTRRVVNEYITPSSDSSIISPHRLFPLPKPKEVKPLFDSDPETIIPELREDDVRRMITDLTLQKGCQVQYEGKILINIPLISLKTSAVIKVLQPNGYSFRWVLCYKSLSVDSSYVDIEASIKDAKEEVKNYVIDWVMKAMIYYYQGGDIGKLSLVITDKDAFDSAVTELKALYIPNEISIILVSTEQNVIIDEFLIPQKFFKII